MKKWWIISAFAMVFIVVIVISIWFYPKQDKIQNEELTFEIVDKTETCIDALEEIYREGDTVYYLPCQKSEYIMLQYSDGSTWTLKEAIKNQKVTMAELESHGLALEIYSSKEVNDDYIEVIPEHAKTFLSTISEDTVILNLEEINSYNEEMRKKADWVYDMNISSISKEQIKKYIESYQVPSLPKYNGKKAITQSDVNAMLKNRNLEKIVDQTSIKKGIVVKRANLKSFPSTLAFNPTYGVDEFDQLQESELHVNTPVLILHESLDQNCFFVLTPFYAGWVLKDKIAYASQEQYDYFIHPDDFVVITDASVSISDVDLDMSVKLPYLGISKEGYQVVLPDKDQDGFVAQKVITVSKDKAHIGYLPYTKKNVYIQAFKYENVKYRWGGMDHGVDCSSYVANVYRTFGLEFPRNTSTQKDSVGNIISLKGKSNRSKLEQIKSTYPSLLYQPGHVMLYLGEIDEKHYILHASGDSMKVTYEELKQNSSHLTQIDRQIFIG